MSGGRRRVKLVGAVACLMLCCGWAQAQVADVHQIAGRVDRFYNSLKSLKADFEQSYRGAGIRRNESGTVWLKQPGRMRWEYRQPVAKVFVTDGHTAWLYVAGEQEARRTAVKNLDDLRSPLRYLLGKTKLEKEFEGLSLAPDVPPANAGDLVLRGVPKAMADRIQQVLLEINPNSQIDRIVIEEGDGSTTEFRFRGIQANSPAAESLFRSPIPPGVRIIEANDLNPE